MKTTFTILLALALWLGATVNTSAELVPLPDQTAHEANLNRTSGATKVYTRAELMSGLAKGISQIEKELADPKLNPKTRTILESILKRRKELLAKYEADPLYGNSPSTNRVGRMPPVPQILPPPDAPVPPPLPGVPQRSVRSIDLPPPNFAAPNGLDPVAVSLSRAVERYERELASPDLNPALRSTYEIMLKQQKKQLAVHEAAAQQRSARGIEPPSVLTPRTP